MSGDRRAMWTRACVMLSVAATLSACGRPAVRAREPTSHVDNDHGFHVGDSVAQATFECLKTPERTIGTVGSLQLVTFSTSADCSMCIAHLSGLEAIAKERRGPPDDFIVTWSPKGSMAEIARNYTAASSRDVCVDRTGALWDELNIQHTPVTVVLGSGRIMYMNDRALVSDSSQIRFLDDLAALGMNVKPK